MEGKNFKLVKAEASSSLYIPKDKDGVFVELNI